MIDAWNRKMLWKGQINCEKVNESNGDLGRTAQNGGREGKILYEWTHQRYVAKFAGKCLGKPNFWDWVGGDGCGEMRFPQLLVNKDGWLNGWKKWHLDVCDACLSRLSCAMRIGCCGLVRAFCRCAVRTVMYVGRPVISVTFTHLPHSWVHIHALKKEKTKSDRFPWVIITFFLQQYNASLNETHPWAVSLSVKHWKLEWLFVGHRRSLSFSFGAHGARLRAEGSRYCPFHSAAMTTRVCFNTKEIEKHFTWNIIRIFP